MQIIKYINRLQVPFLYGRMCRIQNLKEDFRRNSVTEVSNSDVLVWIIWLKFCLEYTLNNASFSSRPTSSILLANFISRCSMHNNITDRLFLFCGLVHSYGNYKDRNKIHVTRWWWKVKQKHGKLFIFC